MPKTPITCNYYVNYQMMEVRHLFQQTLISDRLRRMPNPNHLVF
jgi:hypothetical protein